MRACWHVAKRTVMRSTGAIFLASTASPLCLETAQADVLRVCPAGCAYSSIQAAIEAAANGDVVAIGRGVYAENLKIVDKAVNLKGEGPRQTKIDAGGGRAIWLLCNSLQPVTIHSLTISGGSAGGGGGGGINNGGCDVNASDLVIDSNGACHHSHSTGGGINNNGRLKLSASVVSNNSGGGIINTSNMIMKNTTVVSNTACGNFTGSGVSNSGIFTIVDSVIVNNDSYRGPGGVDNGGTMKITDSVISGNSASVGCGGISSTEGELSILGSTIKNNRAGESTSEGMGGGLCVGTAVTVKNSSIKENQAHRAGGGVYALDGGILTLIGSNVVRNEAYYHADPTLPEDVDVPGDGGGIFAEPGANVTLRNSSVRNNTPNNCVGVGGC